MRGATRVTALLVVVVVAAAALVLDATNPRPEAGSQPSPTPVGLATPDRGSAYCVPLTRGEESAVVTVTAADSASQVRVSAGGTLVEDASVTPDAPLVVELTGDRADAPVTVRWDGAPAVAQYRTEGEGPPVVQSCLPTTEPTWYLPGFTTTLGNQASLHLYNPFSVDAVAQVRYATPDGTVDLVTTQDVAVPAGGTVTLDVDRVQPEVADLGVIVEVLTGRLVAAGEMRFGPPDDDTPAPSGRTAVPATGAPALQQTFAYGAATGDRADSWLVVLNPDLEQDAIITVGVSAPNPDAEVPGEITVPAGGTARVDLADLSERTTFASTVQVVNEVPVVAARVATRDTGEGDDAVSAVDVGASGAPATEWLAVAATGGRTAVIDVYNASGGDTTVEVAPAGVPADAVPQEWAATEIEPNGQRGFPLAEIDAEAALPVRVRAEDPVVVSIRWADEPGGAAGFRTLVAFSPDTWAGLQQRPSVRLAPELGRAPLPSPSPTLTPLPAVTVAPTGPGADDAEAEEESDGGGPVPTPAPSLSPAPSPVPEPPSPSPAPTAGG